MKKAMVVALLGALVGGPGVPAPRHDSGPAARLLGLGRPNIVMILTDDQRADEVRFMPILQSELVKKGLTFTHYYVVNPLCCPSRATTLTGQYSHTNGVYFNGGDHGGWASFRTHEPLSIAVGLHLGGYRTALIGKYLNGYHRASYVPPGWDRWVAMLHPGYFGVPFSIDGEYVKTNHKNYSTDTLAYYANKFIRSVPARQPLFLYFTPFAPHLPAEPAPRDAGAFANVRLHRPPSYDEADVSDKPSSVRRRHTMSAATRKKVDAERVHMLESLLAVDRAIDRLLATLKSTGRLNNTLIMFASDNGFQFGEHRIPDGKNVPYEESVHLPFIVRWDGHVPAGAKDNHVVGNLDLAPTWAGLADVPIVAPDGQSMAPLFAGTASGWREDLLIEHGSKSGSPGDPAFCQVHSDRYSYVLYSTGEEELYDLQGDPYELRNVAGDPAYRSIRNTYRSKEEQLCVPRPPGWTESGGGFRAAL